MPASIDADGLKYFDEHGYIILRNAFSTERVAALLDGVYRMLDAGRAGRCEVDWIDVDRHYPKMTQRLLHPVKYQAAFGHWLDEDVSPHLEMLLDQKVRYSLVTLFSGAPGVPYLMDWHRDIVRLGTADEPRHLAKHHGQLVQFNAPLLPGDDFFWLVPGSHRRASTPQEIRAGSHGAYKRAHPTAIATKEEVADIRADDTAFAMPETLNVRLDPGDVIYYNANIWHRGWQAEGKRRLTIAAAWWRMECPVMVHEHGQRESLLTAGHLDQLPPVIRRYVDRYLSVYPEGAPKSAMEL